MRTLLLGKNGQLGWELQRALAPLGEMVALDFPEIDFSQPASLRRLVDQTAPDVVVCPAAYTAVDRAESEPDLAHRINADAPGVLAEACRAAGAVFVHYSTDYIFDGTKGSPYCEEDAPNPLSVYGRTKLAGEQAVLAAGGAALILRTSWVYSTRVGGFLNKAMQWSRQQQTLRVVSDQISGPTWARMLAEATALVLRSAGAPGQPAEQGSPAEQRRALYGWIEDRAGLYHLAGDGYCSRLEWTRAILDLDPRKEEQTVTEILPALTSEFPAPAARPLFSALDCTRFKETFGLCLPDWKEALALAMG